MIVELTRINEARRKLEIENLGDADCRVSFGPDSKQAEYVIPARRKMDKASVLIALLVVAGYVAALGVVLYFIYSVTPRA